MKIKQKLIRRNFLISESQLEGLSKLKKKLKYSMGELVRKGIDNILEENLDK